MAWKKGGQDLRSVSGTRKPKSGLFGGKKDAKGRKFKGDSRYELVNGRYQLKNPAGKSTTATSSPATAPHQPKTVTPPRAAARRQEQPDYSQHVKRLQHKQARNVKGATGAKTSSALTETRQTATPGNQRKADSPHVASKVGTLNRQRLAVVGGLYGLLTAAAAGDAASLKSAIRLFAARGVNLTA